MAITDPIQLAAAAQLGYAAADRAAETSNPHREALKDLDQLLRSSGRVELVFNHGTGEVEVRCNGVAAYTRGGLYNAIVARIDLEAARVTNKIMGAAGTIGEGTALNQAAKQRP